MHFLQHLTAFESICILVNVLVVGYLIYRMLKRGGVKNSLFDAEILSTTGEAQGRQGSSMKVSFKVHTLDRDGQALVGVECTYTGMGGWSMMPAVFTPGQARELSAALLRAAD